MTNLLDDAALKESGVVANCRMNRDRGCAGKNSYQQELLVNPITFLLSLLREKEHVAWLDLCCGSGRAIVEGSRHFLSEGLADRVSVVGVDLVPTATGVDGDPPVCFVACSALEWQAIGPYDLITCVHGLHYIGDKLTLIRRSFSWLTEDGVFMANLDLANLRFHDGRPAGRSIVKDLRRIGAEYNSGKRLLVKRGRAAFELNFTYAGCDDKAGPNYTGQPAVDSYYLNRAY